MKSWIAFLLFLAALPASAQSNRFPETRIDIDMVDRGASTFYVDVHVHGTDSRQFLVDTGSSYTTINEDMLSELRDASQVEFVKDLEGILADGSRQIVPVYAIKSLTVGGRCRISGVQAAVFPGSTRNILGLSALRSTAPFMFSIDPPVLSLSNCGVGDPVPDVRPEAVVPSSGQ